MQPHRPEAVVQAQRQRGRRHPAAGRRPGHPVADPRRPQRAVRHVADGQLPAELARRARSTNGSIRPLRASARSPEHTDGHDEIACRTSQFTSATGSHGSRCARSASRIRLHCARVAQPHRAQPHQTGGHPHRPDGRRPTRMHGTSNARCSRRSGLVDQPRWARNATSTISPVRICSASLGTTTRQLASASVASRCDDAPGAPPSACTRYSPVSWSRISWPRR